MLDMDKLVDLLLILFALIILSIGIAMGMWYTEHEQEKLAILYGYGISTDDGFLWNHEIKQAYNEASARKDMLK